MARTLEQITQTIFGQQQFQIAGLMAQVEKQHEEIARMARDIERLKAENAALKPAESTKVDPSEVPVNGSPEREARRRQERQASAVQ